MNFLLTEPADSTAPISRRTPCRDCAPCLLDSAFAALLAGLLLRLRRSRCAMN